MAGGTASPRPQSEIVVTLTGRATATAGCCCCFGERLTEQVVPAATSGGCPLVVAGESCRVRLPVACSCMLFRAALACRTPAAAACCPVGFCRTDGTQRSCRRVTWWGVAARGLSRFAVGLGLTCSLVPAAAAAAEFKARAAGKSVCAPAGSSRTQWCTSLRRCRKSERRWHGEHCVCDGPPSAWRACSAVGSGLQPTRRVLCVPGHASRPVAARASRHVWRCRTHQRTPRL